MDLFDIAEIVKTRRQELNLTQAELGARADVSRVRINQLESGNLFEMRFGTILRILNAIDLDFSVGAYNAGRPVFEELVAANEAEESFEP